MLLRTNIFLESKTQNVIYNKNLINISLNMFDKNLMERVSTTRRKIEFAKDNNYSNR
jgi:hypothetical protein